MDKKKPLKSQSQSQSQSTSTDGDAVYQKWRHIPSPSSRGVEDAERSNRRRDAKKNNKLQQASGEGDGEAISVGFSQSTTTSSGFKKQKQSSRVCPPTSASRDHPSHDKNDIDANTDDGKETNHNHDAMPNNSPNSNLRDDERAHVLSVRVRDMQGRVQQQQQLHSQQQQQKQDREQHGGLVVARQVEEEEHHDLYDQILIEDARPHREVHHHVWIVVLVVVSIFAIILGVTLGVTASNKNKVTPTTTTTAPAPTLAPTSLPDMNQIALDFRQILPEETWQAIQNNSSSPQAKAYAWVTWENQPLLYGRDPVQRMRQRFALATLYYATGGESHWVNAPAGWLSYSVSECDWWGCSCNASASTSTSTTSNISKVVDDFSSSKQVTIRTLTLKATSSLRLYGTLPPEIGLLTSLEKFHMFESPGVTGPIPTQLGLLSHLTYLSITSTDLTGTIPRDLVRLTALEVLLLGDNRQLNGSSLTDLCLLTNLRELDLSGTSLSGTIPTEIGRLTKLEFLGLMGSIPAADTNNKLNGTLPTELFLLTNLQELQLRRNTLTGTISPQLGLSLRNLQELLLDRNQFSGSLPSTLGLLSNLERFFVNDNAITGSVPTELCNLVSLGLEFHVDCNNVTCDCDCVC